ncbi:leucine-rich repeat domain-containing protein [Burkholderia dolosa]|uniref:leucine-rich repeat domain-containing protein n=1 Tax=Burkholderia dolosa TaxID=152500 RepID=UPI0027D2A762|nr:leucine-rich repeat domain-containing protein [Burkholderia dolosa]
MKALAFCLPAVTALTLLCGPVTSDAQPSERAKQAVSSAPVCPTYTQDGVVYADIRDRHLLNALDTFIVPDKALGTPLTPDELAHNLPFALDLSENGGWLISDLSGIQCASSLGILDIGNNRVSDFTPLSGMTSLHELLADNNRVTNASLDSLTHLPNLRLLSLARNKISDVRPLVANLPQLASLDLSSNAITDISALAALPLSELFLSSNAISDLSPLSKISTLENLSLDGVGMWDLSILKPLAQLQNLSLAGNRIQDLSPLADLQQLISLNLDGNRITDLSPLIALVQRDHTLEQLQLANQTPTLQCATTVYERAEMRLSDLWKQFKLGSGQKNLHITGPNPAHGGPTRMYDTDKIVWKIASGQTVVPVNVEASTNIANFPALYSAYTTIPLAPLGCPGTATGARQ